MGWTKSPEDSAPITVGQLEQIIDAYELSTMDSRFEVNFAQDGLHTITLEGSVEDIWGNVWRGGGTYEVHVAQVLSLDTAVLPGTPFQPGDIFSAAW